MAKQTTIELVDDLDASSAVATIQFGYLGTNFEIDLSEANSFALRSALEPYITAGRKVTAGVKVQGPRTDKSVTKAIRAWAEANNWELKSRGRIPHEVVEAYHAAV